MCYFAGVQVENDVAKLTGAACRAARALLKWSMRDLADAAKVSLPTILKLENDGAVSSDTADKIVSAFERQRVEITNGDGTGARLRQAAP
jgi:transcriptional regulator with XRE-family HTH domain